MNRRTALKTLGLAGAAPVLTPAGALEAEGNAAAHLARASAILAEARKLGRGGGYDRSWSSSGSPVLLEHEGTRILGASAKGTYCCGFTFAVAMRALAANGALKKKSASDLRAFQKTWFGATSVKTEQERQCAVAVEQLGVGESITADEAMAGDFLQLWRVSKRPSGHSVLFLGWIEVAGQRVGLSYLSSQGSTDGIGHAVEYLHDAGIEGGRVDEKRMYFARLAVS